MKSLILPLAPGILLMSIAIINNPLYTMIAASVIAGIFGYILGHGHGERAERRRWVRQRLERACRLPEKVERR